MMNLVSRSFLMYFEICTYGNHVCNLSEFEHFPSSVSTPINEE